MTMTFMYQKKTDSVIEKSCLCGFRHTSTNILFPLMYVYALSIPVLIFNPMSLSFTLFSKFYTREAMENDWIWKLKMFTQKIIQFNVDVRSNVRRYYCIENLFFFISRDEVFDLLLPIMCITLFTKNKRTKISLVLSSTISYEN